MILKTGMQRRIQIAAILIVLGLLVELGSLFSSRPSAFITFMFVGGLFLGAGILLYLYSLVVPGRTE